MHDWPREAAQTSRTKLQAGTELRIIFAMTLALGVSSPTVTTSSGHGINPGSFSIAPTVNAAETLQLMKLASLNVDDATSAIISDGDERRAGTQQQPNDEANDL